MGLGAHLPGKYPGDCRAAPGGLSLGLPKQRVEEACSAAPPAAEFVWEGGMDPGT